MSRKKIKKWHWWVLIAMIVFAIGLRLYQNHLPTVLVELNQNKLNVLEVVDKISKVINKKIDIEILDIVKNEIKDQYLSSEKAKKILKWETKYSFEQGIKKTIPWYEEHFKVN